MPARYASLAHRKQTFRRGEARDAAVRREVASWPGGVPPEREPEVISYADGLLPDVPGLAHGIVQAEPCWIVQCDGCARVAVGESDRYGRRLNLVILSSGICFDVARRDPRRLCARCRVDAGWQDYDTQQLRSEPKRLEFFEAQMQTHQSDEQEQ